MSEHVLPDVLKQRGEDRQEGKGRVVDDLNDALRVRRPVGKLAQVQILLSLLQVLRRTVEVQPQRGLHRLRPGLHHRSVECVGGV